MHSMLFLVTVCIVLLVADLAVAAPSPFPDCKNGLLAGTPICDPSLPVLERARYIVSRLNVSEKALRLQNTSPAIARVGLPAYEWWSEALHGVAASPGVIYAPNGTFQCATSFPGQHRLSHEY